MNPILLARVLKEELKKINSAEPDGTANLEEELIFERDYAQWMLNQPLDEDAFLLTPDHLTDDHGLIGIFRNGAGTEQQKAIFEQLSEGVRKRISSRKKDNRLAKTVLHELNALLKNGRISPTKTPPEPDSSHKEILKDCPANLTPVAINRLYLQSIFPDWILKVWDTVPLSMVHKWIHAHPKIQPNALCLSGGGIRSATFGLGVLQGLAENGLLPKLQYLSTVSGGGYIGSWLSTWTARENFKKVAATLGQNSIASEKTEGGGEDPEPEEVRHLREYSNYLTPKLGIGSADTWTLVATYLRNLSLNWCVILPALAFVLMVPRLCVALSQRQVRDWLGYTAFALGTLGIVTALVYAAFHRPSTRLQLAEKAGQARFLTFCFLPLYISAACFTSIWAWLQQPSQTFGNLIFPYVQNTDRPLPIWPFMVLAVGSHVAAWLIYFRTLEKKRPREVLACLVSGSIGGLLLWSGARLAHHGFNLHPGTELFVCFGAPWFLGSFLAALFLFVGMTSNFTSDEDREWWARMSAWSLIAMAGWCVFSVLVLFGPGWLLKLPRLIAAIGGISGVVTLVLSHSGVTPANRKEATNQPRQPARSNIVLALAAPVFICCFVAALSLGTTLMVKKFDRWQQLHNGTLLSVDDITDFPSLAAKLKTRADPVSSNLWQTLSPEVKEQVLDYLATGTGLKDTRASVVRGLNGIITNGSILDPELFAASHLSEDTAEALAHPRQGQQRYQLNRVLLQDAFRTELEQSHFDHGMITHYSSLRILLLIWIGLLAIAIVLSLTININQFSLHAIYRNRLIRAYLGASNRRRHPNLFTGFDPDDNLPMSALKYRPFHVVNMALNLVGGQNLAWQQRKAESFTASPLHAGSRWLGYRLVKEYASGKPRKNASQPNKQAQADQKIPVPAERDGGLKLGGAITISGAAASPNMGYHSSPVLAFIMTLFNVRLGAWLGNPGKSGNDSYRDKAPKLAFWHLVREALGMTDDQDRYVYLSDGGHFENLGLYEMVLRRCRTIVVSDAGCDPNCALEDLGNAIRKIRIDLGIPIEIEKFSISSRKSPSSKYCAIGTIRYSIVDAKDGREKYNLNPKSKHELDGTLIYLKPAISGDEPKDIFNYAEQSLLFPHEPTSDQWFSESQFESYRALGFHIVKTLSRGDEKKDEKKDERSTPNRDDALDHFMKQAQNYLEKVSSDLPDLSKRQFSDVVLLGKLAERPPTER